MLDEVARVESVIVNRPETEPDFNELSHVYGAFKNPLQLPELAGDLTDRLIALHCETNNIRSIAMQILDTSPQSQPIQFDDHPSVEQVLDKYWASVEQVLSKYWGAEIPSCRR